MTYIFGSPYSLQFKSEFCNKEFMNWATVISWSWFCWLYRVSPSSAARNTINLISVLTIWCYLDVESSLVLLEEGVCYDQGVLLARLCQPLPCFILYSKAKLAWWAKQYEKWLLMSGMKWWNLSRGGTPIGEQPSWGEGGGGDMAGQGRHLHSKGGNLGPSSDLLLRGEVCPRAGDSGSVRHRRVFTNRWVDWIGKCVESNGSQVSYHQREELQMRRGRKLNWTQQCWIKIGDIDVNSLVFNAYVETYESMDVSLCMYVYMYSYTYIP